MSVDTVKEKVKQKEIVDWDTLISDSKSQIRQQTAQIYKLRKSLTYFIKQKNSGISFPKTVDVDNKDLY